MRGFTVIELLVVISITILLAAAAAPLYGNLQVSSQLNDSASLIVQELRTAKEMSLAGLNNSQHGVYFNINAGTDDSYTLYQGASYAARDTSYDRVTNLTSALSLSSSGFTLTGTDVDINFSKGLGNVSNAGTILISHRSGGTRTISVNSFGKTEEE